MEGKQMLPNDPQLRLSEAHTTMALRHHESSQERLAAEARLVAAADPASHRRSKETAMKSLIRPATVMFTVVIALSALLGAVGPSVPATAGRNMLATSPRALFVVTSSSERMLAIDSTSDMGQQMASRRRVL
jgi:hypothetical protein